MEANTPLQTWHEAVKEAQNDAHITLSEDLESYLVFLLMRFMRRPELAQSLCGLEFLQAHNRAAHQHAFQEVGDKCLLFSGLFPAIAVRRHVSVQYYIAVGQSAYTAIAEHDFKEQPLFKALATQFVLLRDVLCCLRKDANKEMKENLLSALDLWHHNQSEMAFRTLEEEFGDTTRLFRPDKNFH